MRSHHSSAAGSRGAVLLIAALFAGPLLAQSATIEGTITENGSGTGLAGATVAVSTSYKQVVASGTTGPGGAYSVTVSVPAGGSDEFVVEAAGPGHAPARHGFTGPLSCFFGCGAGGEITVSDGATVTGIDIALDPGGRISGAVTASDTGNGLENASVVPIDSNTFIDYSYHFAGSADASGNYTTALAVAPGDYHVWAQPAPAGFGLYADNYVAEAWNDRTCELLRCPIGNTDTVTTSAGATLGGIDFDLAPGATISGNLGPGSVEKLVDLYDGAGRDLTFRWFSSEQLPATAWSFNGLKGGSYYVQFGPLTASTYLRKLHNGLPCPWGGCERARGPALSLPAGASLALPSVTLDQGGQIEGVIIDADTNTTPAGSPADASLGLYDLIDATGTVVGGGAMSTDATGAITMEPSFAVPPGNYYVRTHNQWVSDAIGDAGFGSVALPGYMDAVFPDQPCAGIDCDLSGAATVSVTSGNVNSIILEVDTGSEIDGRVVDAATSTPIPDAMVRVVDASGDTKLRVLTDSNGDFRFGALPAGDYYVRTSMSSSLGPGHYGVQNPYFDRVHGAPGSCSEALCDPTTGTTISLDGSTDQSLGNIAVSGGPIISGQIIEVPSGYPIPRGQVEVYTDTGEFVGAYKVSFFDATYRTTALSPGTYTLVPVVSPVYGTVSTSGGTAPRAAGQSGLLEGISVTIGNKDVEANIQVVDQAFDRLFSDRFDNVQ